MDRGDVNKKSGEEVCESVLVMRLADYLHSQDDKNSHLEKGSGGVGCSKEAVWIGEMSE